MTTVVQAPGCIPSLNGISIELRTQNLVSPCICYCQPYGSFLTKQLTTRVVFSVKFSCNAIRPAFRGPKWINCRINASIYVRLWYVAFMVLWGTPGITSIEQVRLAVVKVDVEAIESGRAKTSQETFHPVWMDIGGSCGGAREGFNGGISPGSPHRRSGNEVAVTGGSGRTQGGASGRRAGAAGGRRETGRAAGSAGRGKADKKEKEKEIYLARVNWLQDGSLCAQVQNRAQTELRLLRLDPETGRPATLLVEKSKVWINLHHLLRSLPSPAPQVKPPSVPCLV